VIDEVRVYGRALGIEDVEEDRDVAVGAPSMDTPPGVRGIPQETYKLKADSGEWISAEPLTFSYQWERCSSVAPTCENVAGATSKDYVLKEADVGSRMRLRVKASNSVADAYAVSVKTATITQSAPRFESQAVISGSAVVGNSFSVNTSSLKGSQPIMLSYEWERCTEYCAQAGEAETYKLAEADAATQIRVRVIAENEVGSKASLSVPSAYVAPVKGEGVPQLVEPPRLIGSPRVSEPIETTAGKWIGPEVNETMVGWERCPEGLESCETIPEAASSSYLLSELDEGTQLRSRVTAVNAFGSTLKRSALTPEISPEVHTSFLLGKPVPLEDAMEAIASAETDLISLNYGGSTNGIYINDGVKSSEVVGSLSELLNEDSSKKPVRAFVLEGSVSSESLGGFGEAVQTRSEFVPFTDGDYLGTPSEHLQDYANNAVSAAKLEAWASVDNIDFDGPLDYRKGHDRILKSSFTWSPTLGETIDEMYKSGSSLALEFDIKELNRGNLDDLVGLCLPWEKNNFWIGSRHPGVIDTTIPAEAGLYWDTAALDSCEEKDLSFGVYHPEDLDSNEMYDTAVYFKGDSGTESAAGDTDSSSFTWTMQIMGSHCDTSPWCVGIDYEDIPALVLR